MLKNLRTLSTSAPAPSCGVDPSFSRLGTCDRVIWTKTLAFAADARRNQALSALTCCALSSLTIRTDDQSKISFCTDEAYQAVYREAGLKTIRMFKPLAKGHEPYKGVNEMIKAPWVISGL